MANIHTYSRPITSKCSNLPENQTYNAQKVGKKEMACSTKPVMKIKEVKKVVPPETLD